MYASTLEKKISKFVRRFGVRRAYCRDQFMYHGDTIDFSILTDPEDRPYIDFLNNKYDTDIEPWFFIFCILHEVGHYITVPLLSKEELAYEYEMRMFRIQKSEDYFDLPAENLANKWAINYIMNHPQECWDFQNKCYKIMRHIFKKRSFHL